ncbi:MAG: thioredoxin domain-containing protein [Gemmatimonadota bacterium]
MANRLSRETSPYLLQHAHNPVDWFPWGEEALTRARAEDRPILLSIGYSACHWCHVMERESFEDPETAELMNREFVNIKVDREERPDVDQIYMRAVQAMTGSGGWPLTVFLTPEGHPFYGGTYFPPVPRHGLPSFRQILAAAAAAYRDRPDDVRAAARDLVRKMEEAQGSPAGPSAPAHDAGGPGAALLDEAVRGLGRAYDSVHGGFGRAPKFPQPTTLEFLLRHHARTGDPRALEMAVTTLERMAAGGIRDHLEGGFHRYSVDGHWLVPHFEKMLYDNALLARAYLDAYRATGRPGFREVATETLDYILADLRSPEGGFFSARDADSEGEEGRFYVWSLKEVEEVLGRDAPAFRLAYGLTEEGNFEGKNILHLPRPTAEAARELGVEEAELKDLLSRCRVQLTEARARRVHPLRDEKILTSWTALTLRALAEAAAVLHHEGYREAARDAGRFILSRARRDGGLFLFHVVAGGQTRIPGFLEDYGATANAFLSLHEATLDPQWADHAAWAVEAMVARFHHEDDGRFYDTAAAGEELILRPRDPMDNPTPSGNSLAAEALLRAGHLLGREEWTTLAERLLVQEAAAVRRFPTAFGRLLSVAERATAPPVEVAVVGERSDPSTYALLAAAAAPLLPNLTLTGRAPAEELPLPIPLLEGREAAGGRPTAYVCRNLACRAPVTDPEDVSREMES